MTRKKKHDELETAANASLESDAGAPDATADAAPGPDGGEAPAPAGEPEAGTDALAAGSEDAGHLQGTDDPVAASIDAEGDEPETEEAVSDGQEAGQGGGDGEDDAAPWQRDPSGEGSAAAGQDEAGGNDWDPAGDGDGAGAQEPQGGGSEPQADDGDDTGAAIAGDEHRHARADYETSPALSPRQIAIVAAAEAASAVYQAAGNPDLYRHKLGDPEKSRLYRICAILDKSPDLPISAIITEMGLPTSGAATAAALRATYVGMRPWVEAEDKRLAPPPKPLLRKGGYEKSGRIERGHERVMTRAEQRRLRRQRAQPDQD